MDEKKLDPEHELPPPEETHDRTHFLSEDTPRPAMNPDEGSIPPPHQDPTAFDARPLHRQPLISPKMLFIAFAILILVVSALGAVLYLRNRASNPPTELPIATTQTPQPTTTPQPTPTTTPINLADYSVEILNGSGISGEATRVKNLLETATFETFSIGNASSYDYTNTEVSMKQDVPEVVFASLQDALTEYSLITADVLDATDTVDIRIVIGVRIE